MACFSLPLILIGGVRGDSLGRRAMFVLGVAVFATASVGCGLSSSIRSLVIWRCVQGIGAAFLVPGSLAIISASFDEESRGRAIGTWSGFTAITTALGPVLWEPPLGITETPTVPSASCAKLNASIPPGWMSGKIWPPILNAETCTPPSESSSN